MTNKKKLLIGTFLIFLFLAIYAASLNGKKTFWGNYEAVSGPGKEVRIEILQEGSGELAVKTGDRIMINYIAASADGTTLESNLGNEEPLSMLVGSADIIKGWNEGLIGMRVGERRKITVPPELAYGKIGRATVPPDATIIFEVILLEIM